MKPLLQQERPPSPPPEPAPLPLPRNRDSRLFEVEVPHGVQPGSSFPLIAGGQRILVLCPLNAQPGGRIRFYVDGEVCACEQQPHTFNTTIKPNRSDAERHHKGSRRATEDMNDEVALVKPDAHTVFACNQQPRNLNKGIKPNRTLVTATVNKPSADYQVGIGLKASANGSIYISSLAKGGLCSSTDLEVGLCVLSINNQQCQGMTVTEAITLIKHSTGTLTILATDEQVPSATTVAPDKETSNFHPRGTLPGGEWGRNNYRGENTCGLSIVCLLCLGIPGIICLLCPLDQRDVYKVNGKVYNAEGKYIGLEKYVNFISDDPQKRPKVNPNRIRE